MSQISAPTSQPDVHSPLITSLPSLAVELASITTAERLASLLGEAVIHNEDGVILLSVPSFSGRVSATDFVLTLKKIDQCYHSLTVFEIPFEERLFGVGCRENLRCILLSNEKESFLITLFKQAAFFIAPCFLPAQAAEEGQDPALLEASQYMEEKEIGFTRMWLGREYRYISPDKINDYAHLYPALAQGNSASLQNARMYYEESLSNVKQIYDNLYSS